MAQVATPVSGNVWLEHPLSEDCHLLTVYWGNIIIWSIVVCSDVLPTLYCSSKQHTFPINNSSLFKFQLMKNSFHMQIYNFV